jgi:hypothetical protein
VIVSTSPATQLEARPSPIGVGERAPDFVLKTANAVAGLNVGDNMSLNELIARGPVIVEFLRGTW